MKADMDRKTARKYIAGGKLLSELATTRDWRTRPRSIRGALVGDRGAAAAHAEARGEDVRMLNQSDFSALERFAALSPQLRLVLDNDTYAMLRRQIDNIEFGDVARTLEALRL